MPLKNTKPKSRVDSIMLQGFLLQESQTRDKITWGGGCPVAIVKNYKDFENMNKFPKCHNLVFFFFSLNIWIIKLSSACPHFPSFCLCSGLGWQDLRACERLFGSTLSHWAGSLSSNTQHLPVLVGQIHQSELRCDESHKPCFILILRNNKWVIKCW